MIEGVREIGHDPAIDEPDDEADPIERGDRPPGFRRVVGRQHRAADHRQRDERPDRKIEAAADEDEDLAGRQNRQRRRAAQEIHDA